MPPYVLPAPDNDALPAPAPGAGITTPLGTLVTPSLGLVAPYTTETVPCRCDDDHLFPALVSVTDVFGQRVVRTYSEIVGTFVTVLVSRYDRATTRALTFVLATGSQARISRMIEDPTARDAIVESLFEDEIFACALNRSDLPVEAVSAAVHAILSEREDARVCVARRTRILQLRQRIEANELSLRPHPTGENVVAFRRR